MTDPAAGPMPETSDGPWLTLVGIGEDGLDGLAPAVRTLVLTAPTVVGGQRHLDMVPADHPATRIPWAGLTETLAAILVRRHTPVVVLASGDPMHYGLGATLTRHLDPAEMAVLPHVGAFSLAAARLGWAVQDVRCLTVHGRPPESIVPHLAPGARLLVLAADGTTAAELCPMLADRGYGPSLVSALWHLGGPREGRRDATAAGWGAATTPDLVTLAITCRAAEGARVLPRTPGLPDDAFRHDGQLTKRVVRAATLAALAPLPGQRLWDVGAGCGSIAIEWLRAVDGASAVAIEQDAGRRAMIAENARTLGTPGLEVVAGEAPVALADAGAAPDAIFVGGGVSRPTLLEACWEALKPGGRMVANAVTVEAEARLIARRAAWDGTLTRLAVSHPAATPGGLLAWKALAPVTQLVAVKP